MAAFDPYDQAVIRSEPDLTQRPYGESPVPSIRDIDERLGGFSTFIVYRQDRGVCIIFDTDTRISEECPMAIHCIELRLKGLAAVGFIYFGRADA
jgi:hypothetical protein